MAAVRSTASSEFRETGNQVKGAAVPQVDIGYYTAAQYFFLAAVRSIAEFILGPYCTVLQVVSFGKQGVIQQVQYFSWQQYTVPQSYSWGLLGSKFWKTGNQVKEVAVLQSLFIGILQQHSPILGSTTCSTAEFILGAHCAVPRAASWEELNEKLRVDCGKRRERRLRGHKETIGERFQKDREMLLPLP